MYLTLIAQIFYLMVIDFYAMVKRIGKCCLLHEVFLLMFRLLKFFKASLIPLENALYTMS